MKILKPVKVSSSGDQTFVGKRFLFNHQKDVHIEISTPPDSEGVCQFIFVKHPRREEIGRTNPLASVLVRDGEVIGVFSHMDTGRRTYEVTKVYC